MEAALEGFQAGMRRHHRGMAAQLGGEGCGPRLRQLLVLVSRDRPGRECDTEPGFTGLPRASAASALAEDVEDLEEPVGDMARFDECLYTIGVHERGGSGSRDRREGLRRRGALSFDLGRDCRRWT
jgi:hypothetical protein